MRVILICAPILPYRHKFVKPFSHFIPTEIKGEGGITYLQNKGTKDLTEQEIML
jgi:hypothetical protein